MNKIEAIDEDTLRLPDGSLAFSLRKAIEESKRLEGVDFSIAELILMVFYAQRENSIRGRTVALKEVFLIDREVFGEYVFTWEQVPGTDTFRLIEYLRSHLGLHLSDNAVVKKDYGDRGLRIRDGSRGYRLIMDRFDTTISLYRETRSDSMSPATPIYRFFVRVDSEGFRIFGRNVSVEDCNYVPYHYGPYSFLVANKLENLVDAGLLWRTGKKDTRNEVFKITKVGEEVIAPKFNNLAPGVGTRISMLRQGLDQLGRDGILRFVYETYPQYRAKSRIGKRYKLITWGRGKG